GSAVPIAEPVDSGEPGPSEMVGQLLLRHEAERAGTGSSLLAVHEQVMRLEGDEAISHVDHAVADFHLADPIDPDPRPRCGRVPLPPFAGRWGGGSCSTHST